MGASAESTTVKEKALSNAAGRASASTNANKQVQEMQRVEHLRGQPRKKHVQAMRRVEHLRAQPPEKQVQAMRRVKHLRAQPRKKQVQTIRVEHLMRRVEH